MVQHGYSLPFVDGRLPPPYFNNRNDFEPGSEQWARDEVHRLCEFGAVRPWSGPGKPSAVMPLKTIRKAGYSATNRKFRLCHNARYINRFLPLYKFSLDQLWDWGRLVQQFDRVWKTDISAAYLHVEIAPHHQRFLGFQLGQREDGSPRYYVFTSLPFGLSTAV